MNKQRKSVVTKEITTVAMKDSFKKLNPRTMMKNPVMFVVYIGCILTLLLTIIPNLFGASTPGARIYN